eukprot:gb/GECG01002890.1/.p1 GENE.gb/GECG01002890.1/~~gb/GECG01002890.1/.p1  ORF type:complete len:1135 (+),score=100.43 gb/GECG01002890.1/:1-3405(+)
MCMQILFDRFILQASVVAQISSTHVSTQVKQFEFSDRILSQLRRHGVIDSDFISQFVLNGGKIYVHQWQDCRAALITLAFSPNQDLDGKHPEGGSGSRQTLPPPFSRLDSMYRGNAVHKDPASKEQQKFQESCLRGSLAGEFYESTVSEASQTGSSFSSLFKPLAMEHSMTEIKLDGSNPISSTPFSESMHALVYCGTEARNLDKFPQVVIDVFPYRCDNGVDIIRGIDSLVGKMMRIRREKFLRLFRVMKGFSSDALEFDYVLNEIPSSSVTARFDNEFVQSFPEIGIRLDAEVDFRTLDIVNTVEESLQSRKQSFHSLLAERKRQYACSLSGALSDLHGQLLSHTGAQTYAKGNGASAYLGRHSANLSGHKKRRREWEHDLERIVGSQITAEAMRNKFSIVSSALYGLDSAHSEADFIASIIGAWIGISFSSSDLKNIFSYGHIWSNFDEHATVLHFSTRFTRLLSIFDVISNCLAVDSMMSSLQREVNDYTVRIRKRRQLYDYKDLHYKNRHALSTIRSAVGVDLQSVFTYRREQTPEGVPCEHAHVTCLSACRAMTHADDVSAQQEMKLLSYVSTAAEIRDAPDKIIWFEPKEMVRLTMKLYRRYEELKDREDLISRFMNHAKSVKYCFDLALQHSSHPEASTGVVIPVESVSSLSIHSNLKILHPRLLECVLFAAAQMGVAHVCFVEKCPSEGSGVDNSDSVDWITTYHNTDCVQYLVERFAHDAQKLLGSICVWISGNDTRQVSSVAKSNSELGQCATAFRRASRVDTENRQRIVAWACVDKQLRHQKMVQYYRQCFAMAGANPEKVRLETPPNEVWFERDMSDGKPQLRDFEELNLSDWFIKQDKIAAFLFVDVEAQAIVPPSRNAWTDPNIVGVHFRLPKFKGVKHRRSGAFCDKETDLWKNFQAVTLSLFPPSPDSLVELGEVDVPLGNRHPWIDRRLTAFAPISKYLKCWNVHSKTHHDCKIKLDFNGSLLLKELQEVYPDFAQLVGSIELEEEGTRYVLRSKVDSIDMHFSSLAYGAEDSGSSYWIDTMIRALAALLISRSLSRHNSGAPIRLNATKDHPPFSALYTNANTSDRNKTRVFKLMLKRVPQPCFTLSWAVLKQLSTAAIQQGRRSLTPFYDFIAS